MDCPVCGAGLMETYSVDLSPEVDRVDCRCPDPDCSAVHVQVEGVLP